MTLKKNLKKKDKNKFSTSRWCFIGASPLDYIPERKRKRKKRQNTVSDSMAKKTPNQTNGKRRALFFSVCVCVCVCVSVCVCVCVCGARHVGHALDRPINRLDVKDHPVTWKSTVASLSKSRVFCFSSSKHKRCHRRRFGNFADWLAFSSTKKKTNTQKKNKRKTRIDGRSNVNASNRPSGLPQYSSQ